MTVKLTRVQMLSLAILLLFLGTLALFRPLLLTPLSDGYFDLLHHSFPRSVERLPVLIVDIDERSLVAHGQWPWPRWRTAELVEKAGRMGPLAIGMDMIMPEPDRFSPRSLALEPDMDPGLKLALEGLPDPDMALARALSNNRVVIGRAGHNNAMATTDAAAIAAPAVSLDGELDAGTIPAFNTALGNHAPIENAAAGHGLLNALPDEDGVIRRTPLLFSIGDNNSVSLAVEVLRIALGANWTTVIARDGTVRGLRMGDVEFTTEKDGSIRPHFSASLAQRRVSAADVMAGRLEDGYASGQIMLIGATAVGLSDVVTIPAQSRMDGVEVQAQVIENLVDDSRLVRPSWASPLEFMVAFLAGLLLILLFPFAGPTGTPFAWLALTLLAVIPSGIAFSTAGLLVDPVPLLVCTAASFISLALLYWRSTERERRRLDAELVRERLEQARITGELDAARQIQMGILPDTAAIDHLPETMDVHAFLEPANEIGGDYYDTFMLDSERLFFVIADISGKGVPAALFMALSKSLGKSIALQQRVSVSAIMESANREISRDNVAQLFVTAIFGIVDTANGEVSFCNAGHDPPFLVTRDEGVRRVHSESGIPLCIWDDYEYPVNTLTLSPGDALLMFTDGVTEAIGTNGEFYGTERVEACLHALPSDSGAEEIVNALRQDVGRFSSGVEAADDTTMLCIRLRGQADPSMARL